MTFVPHSRVLPPALWRPVLFCFAALQIFLSFAPLIEAQRGPDARAHVEAAGTTLHHAHNDADCVACVARTLLASSQPGEGYSPALLRLEAQLALPSEAPVESPPAVASRSRAPPLSI